MKKILSFIFLMAIARPALAFDASDFSAISTNSNSDQQWFYGFGRDAITNTYENIIFWVLMIAGALGFIALLVGAGQYLLAAGDPQKATTAKKTITYSIVGIIIIIVFIVILEFIGGNLFKTS